MSEQWRDIPGFDGDYQVSNFGRVRSLKFGKERILVTHPIMGYPSCVLHKQGQTTHYVHRLVAESFLPPDDERPHINHKDGDRANNHVSNLERCTPSENIRHAYRELGFQGAMGYRKLSGEQLEQAVAMRRAKVSPAEIAKRLGIGMQAVRAVYEAAPETKYTNKLSDSDVPQIHAMRASGMTLKQIAAEFDVTDSMICRVLKGNRRNRQERAS